MLNVYFLTLLLVIPVLVSVEKRSNISKRANRFAVWYTIIIFLIIMGFRDNATISILNGRQSDEYNYRKAFELLIGSSFSLKNIQSLEWARYLLDWLLANIFKNSQTWVFVYAAITNILFVKAIRRFIQPFWMGIFLYITVGLYTFQINGTTSVISAAILTLAIKPIVERRFIKTLLIIAIAAGFHSSAWIMLPLYFVLTNKKISKTTFLWIIVSLVFMIYFVDIANIILPHTPYTHYLYQINSSNIYGVNVLRSIFFLIVYAFILFRSRKIKYKSDYDIYFNNSIIALIFINIVSLSYVYMHRFNELFIFALIVMLPRVINTFKNNEKILVLFFVLLSFLIFGIQQNWNVLYKMFFL